MPIKKRVHDCQLCGKAFFHQRSGANRFCSRECGFKGLDRTIIRRQLAQRAAGATRDRDDWVHWHASTCKVCSQPFMGTKGRVTCSDGCSTKNASNGGYVAVPKNSVSCVECGALFLGPGGSEFCSIRCRRRVARRAARAKRSAKYAETEGMSERVTFRSLWERSSRCHICGELCSRRYVGSHPLAPTVDHIVPISRGGRHLVTNAAIAHMICNGFKGVGAVTEALAETCRRAVAQCKAGDDGWSLYPADSTGGGSIVQALPA